ncbi:hypothetical protein FALBO_2183 [Fusarium albosuccineum]|uniref:Uncharacterized protein n=1 Tax=Fusarium albosuccineum TaxID=1237068 RepID=A0A8H4LMN1_9HYPO|nr:hypothetical protein FALBO_2183 [Fusarium albosuccineum]
MSHNSPHTPQDEFMGDTPVNSDYPTDFYSIDFDPTLPLASPMDPAQDVVDQWSQFEPIPQGGDSSGAFDQGGAFDMAANSMPQSATDYFESDFGLSVSTPGMDPHPSSLSFPYSEISATSALVPDLLPTTSYEAHHDLASVSGLQDELHTP